MDGYKDFQGKTLDDAIREATAYFDVAREKLEIDIIHDAKSGVFGLIGARKAKVRARRVQLKTTVEDLVGRGHDLRASFRAEYESGGYADDGVDADMFASRNSRRDDSRYDDVRREEARRDESRRDGNRERDARRGRNDKQNRSERDEVSRLDDAFTRSDEERAGERSQEERKSHGRRQRNDRQDRNVERSEKNQDRNADRPRRNDRNRSERSQSRDNAPQAEGNQEPFDDENGMMDAESRERSSRRRRRGRGRSRSRTDDNNAEGMYNDNNGMDQSFDGSTNIVDAQDMMDYEDAGLSASADYDAPRYDSPRRNGDGRRSQRHDDSRRDDGRRSGERRENGSRRENGNPRPADRRDSEGRRDGESRRQGEGRRTNYDRQVRNGRNVPMVQGEANDRPYRDTERQAYEDQSYEAQARDFAQSEAPFDDQAYERPEGLPDIPLESLDQELVRSVAFEVTERLVSPIIGPAALTVEAVEGRVKVGIDCGENSGLLIGREGQTLASIQYLASRIIARKLGAAVRVQLDTGDYRERQDEKLRELALSFADRVRVTGRPQSTRPLSSYHRRVVHLALQDDEEIVTRSKGEGPLKRVIILRRRKNGAE